MKINFTKTSHILFFAAFLPILSWFASLGFHRLLPNPPFWLETVTPLFAYIVFYSVFEKWLWCWKIFSWLGIVEFPDLRGRWKGKQRSTYKENGDNVETPSYLEVSQTFSKIMVCAYYGQSQSQSVVADFTKMNEKIYFFYTYDNEPSSLKSGTMQMHKGTVKLKYVLNEKKLMGTYFNSIGNSGEMEFEFEQDELLERLKMINQ